MAYTSGASGAFNPIGNTVTFLANITAPTAVQPVQPFPGSASVSSYVQYRVFNAGTNLVFMGYGANTLIANNNALVVTTTANSIPVLPGTCEVLSLPANTYLTGITASGNSQVYVTPGLGI